MLRHACFLVAIAAAIAAADDLPRVDLHAHIHDDQNPAASLKPADVAALSRNLGVRFGVLAEGGCAGEIHDDASLQEFLTETDGVPVWRGLQVYGFDWPRCLSAVNRKKLDYIAADALVFPRDGKNIALWHAGVKFDDAQEFMNEYVEFNVRVLSQNNIQVWANPTYLPDSLQPRYAELWTPERMDRVIRAAVKNHVAIEINDHFRIPSANFIRRAKAAGAKFSFGSNRHVHGIGNIEYCVRAATECGLTSADIFVPARKL